MPGICRVFCRTVCREYTGTMPVFCRTVCRTIVVVGGIAGWSVHGGVSDKSKSHVACRHVACDMQTHKRHRGRELGKTGMNSLSRITLPS